MPELPEVEVARRGIAIHVEKRRLLGADVRAARLRHELDAGLGSILAGREVEAIERRGKYLLFRCASSDRRAGWLILHLGMSGSLRWIAAADIARTPAERHDHVDLVFGEGLLRYRDPRRFGTLLWVPGDDVLAHPLLAPLGIEPLGPEFCGRWLHEALRRRQAPIKPVLMDSHTIVGVGNIYASESLFRAGISPQRAANRIGATRCDRLAEAVKATLLAAIEAGGSSLRDYVHADGGSGCFQVDCAVYERAGEPCRVCARPVKQIRQTGRSTYYCPQCQK